MPAESGIRQRAIVGRRLGLADAELLTKYTLPFVDASWKTAFTVFDLVGSPPRLLEGAIRWDGSHLRSPAARADLRRIESIPLAELGLLVHYDPWWAFRGVSGVDRAWIEAAFATNIARPFVRERKKLKVHDLQFAEGMGRLEAVLCKDEMFRLVEFHPGEIDLSGLRGGKRSDRHEGMASTTAKAL